jgi:hypothetical protein
VTSEKIGGSGVISTLGTWYGGVVMGVLLPFNEAAILYRHFNRAPLQKQNIIVFAANNSSHSCGTLSYSLCFSNQIDQGDETEGFEREGSEIER